MSMIDRLIEQLKKRGLKVGPGDKPGELKLHGPRSEATPEIMKALRTFKTQLLERYELKSETMPESNGHCSESETLDESDPEPERAAGSSD